VVSLQSHGVQLFDTRESLSSTVGEFTREGLHAGDSVVLVVTAAHWDSIHRWGRLNGLNLDAARQRSALIVLDAHAIVASIIRRDRPDWGLFEKHVATLVSRLSEGGRRVRVFGEAVDVLARASDFGGAQQLEDFWNRAIAGRSIQLLCGYSAEHFGNPRDAHALRHICGQHSEVHSEGRDVLGNFLLKAHVAC
jgi:hypothetical protein